MPSRKQTIDATTWVVLMLEISKHSITRGIFGNCRASAKARRSASGSIVVGREPRVKRRVGRVVRRKSSSMLRNSAAFSKSSFSACAHLFFQLRHHFAGMSFEKFAGLRDAFSINLRRNLA